MIKEIIQYFIFLVFICSCSPNGTNSTIHLKGDSIQYELNINPEKLDKVLLSQIADRIEYVTLETTPYSSIGKIDKIICRDSLIFISDVDNTESVYCFNRNGRFKFKISSKGRGPREYIELEDFTVNFDTKKLILHDGSARKLLYYNLDGKYIYTEQTDISLTRFEAISGERILYYSGHLSNPSLFKDDYYQVFICDNKNKVNVKYFPFDRHKNLFLNEIGIMNNISINSDGVYVYPHSGRIIYKLNGKNLDPYIQLSFGDKTIPDNFIEIYTRQEQNALAKEGKFVQGLGSFQIISNWLIGVFEYKTKLKFLICNIETDFLNITRIVNNDLDSFPISFIPPFFTDGNSLICIIEPYMIEKIRQVVKTIPKDLLEIEENSNPVLQFIKLK